MQRDKITDIQQKESYHELIFSQSENSSIGTTEQIHGSTVLHLVILTSQEKIQFHQSG